MAHHHHHRHEECVTLENPSIHSNNWWINDLHACSLPSWSTSNSTCWQADQPKNNYNNNNNNNINLSDDQSSGDDENVSISTSTFTNVSNHSDLSAESVRNNFVESGGGGGGAAAGNEQFVGETVVGSDHNHQHQLWNHLLLNVGCREELQNQDADGLMFNPTCDNNNNYSTSLTSFNNGVKNHHFINVLGENPIIDSPREPINKSSSDMVDLINNWQIPNQDSTTATATISSSGGNELLPPPPTRRGFGSAIIKEEGYNNDHHMMMMMMMTRNDNLGSVSSCFGHDIMKLQGAGDHHQEHGGNIMNDSSWCTDNQYSRMAAYSSSSSGSSNLDLNIRDSRRSSSRSFSSTADLMAANPSSSYINNNNNNNMQNRRPLMLDINLSKPFLKTLDLSASCRKQGFRHSPYMKFPSPTSISKTPTKRNGRTHGNEGRKLSGSSSEDNSESVSKKPKQETSAVLSSTKVPKVKLGDKITALQQIVSPFGKTDTASVLWEAIGYIRFLQEQIQLLSTPYLKGCASKELWGGVKRKEREGKGDLRSRGLCLVPISCTPQMYPADNAASDYLTPVYRGCLYR